MKKFLKCALWFAKEYANVGIALALFMLIGLQIEKQYRSDRYIRNCIEDTNWVKGVDYYTKVDKCATLRARSVPFFNYHRGRVSKYIEEF